ncbi:hypothetical protein CB1_000568086 [Camelus ferus]|nr:hypothetical protein CB1_000568086 [Camelus ferus]
MKQKVWTVEGPPRSPPATLFMCGWVGPSTDKCVRTCRLLLCSCSIYSLGLRPPSKDWLWDTLWAENTKGLFTPLDATPFDVNRIEDERQAVCKVRGTRKALEQEDRAEGGPRSCPELSPSAQWACGLSSRPQFGARPLTSEEAAVGGRQCRGGKTRRRFPGVLTLRIPTSHVRKRLNRGFKSTLEAHDEAQQQLLGTGPCPSRARS